MAKSSRAFSIGTICNKKGMPQFSSCLVKQRLSLLFVKVVPSTHSHTESLTLVAMPDPCSRIRLHLRRDRQTRLAGPERLSLFRTWLFMHVRGGPASYHSVI